MTVHSTIESTSVQQALQQLELIICQYRQEMQDARLKIDRTHNQLAGYPQDQHRLERMFEDFNGLMRQNCSTLFGLVGENCGKKATETALAIIHKRYH